MDDFQINIFKPARFLSDIAQEKMRNRRKKNKKERNNNTAHKKKVNQNAK